jgi:NADH-quinone oxidoreductase subunit M
MDTFDDWVLTLAVFTPLVGAIVMMLVPRDREDAHKGIALISSLATLGFGIYLLAQFDYGESRGGLQFAVDEKWIDVIGSRYQIGIDGISLPLLVLSMFITVVVIIYSW